MAAARKQKVQLPSLLGGPVPLVSIRDQARKHLLDLIDQKRGTKALVLDPTISGPLTLLEPSLPEGLAEHGVMKLVHLETKGVDDASSLALAARLSDVRNVMYIVRATVENMQAIAAQVKSSVVANKAKQQQQEFSVFLVPRRTIACQRVLEEEGILGDLFVGEFPLDLIPLEDDVLSLELEAAFSTCVVEGDSTPLFHVACALTKLQAMFGLIPRLQGKGPAAVAVRDMCIRMRRENASSLPLGFATNQAGAALISRAVLIDREADIITPMMTQITYEGLVDEVTGIRNGAVPWVPKDKPAAEGRVGTSAPPAPPGARGGSTMLNSTDPFYQEFRNLPYHIAIQRLQHYARETRREYTELGSKDLSELKSFVKGLPKLMMLDRLSDIATPVAEQVKEQSFHDRLKHEQEILEGYDTEAQVAFIEELMCRGAPLLEVLRLLVLLNECHQGLSKKHLDLLRQELLHTYGHQHLLTLNNLETAGFIRPASSQAKASFREMRKTLRLSVPQEDDQQQPAGAGAASEVPSFKPNDVSFLYNGYAPLSIRLVEAALSPLGWSPFAEALALLPGTQFDIVQTVDAQGLPSERPYRTHLQQQLQQQQQEQASAMHADAGAPPGPSSAAPSPGPGGAGLGDSSAATGNSGVSTPAVSASARALPTEPGGVYPEAGDGREVVLVVFIGGVTFSEISALRYLENRSDSTRRFLVMTTRIINGTTLLQSFVDATATQAGNAVGLQ